MVSPISTLPSTTNWTSVASHSCLIVALGLVSESESKIATSEDGVVWTAQPNLLIKATKVRQVNGIFFAFNDGSSGASSASYAVSTDGVGWSYLTFPVPAYGATIAWDGTVYCLSVTSSAGYVSVDGATWIPANFLLGGVGYKVAGTSGALLSVAGQMAPVGVSVDHASSWTESFPPVYPSDTAFAVLRHGSTWYVQFRYGFTAIDTFVSPSASTWTRTRITIDNYGVTYLPVASNGSKVCVVNGYKAYLTVSGATIESVTLPVGLNSYDWEDITWNGRVFCLVNSYGEALTSPDGLFVEYEAPVIEGCGPVPFWTNSRGQREVL